MAGAGAAVLLLTRRIPRARILALVDVDLLVLFVSLFVLMAGTRAAGLLEVIHRYLGFLRLDSALGLSAVTLVLSNLCSNVPAVLFLAHLGPPAGGAGEVSAHGHGGRAGSPGQPIDSNSGSC